MHAAQFEPLPQSYYHATQNLSLTTQQLTQDETTDVCIIGAGLAGISCALELAKAGLNVTVLEAQQIGFGASGRNGGQVISSYACEMEYLTKHLGIDLAKNLWQWSLDAVNLVEQRVNEYQIECSWQRGYATLAIKNSHLKALESQLEFHRQHLDYSKYQLWNQEETQALIKSQRYIGALYDADSGQIHPLNYCLGLARAAMQAGARLLTNSPVTDIKKTGEQWLIQSPAAKIQAKHVVLACNSYAGSVNNQYFKALSKKIMPVGTYMIATEPLQETDSIMPKNLAVCDANFVLDYYRLSNDNRLLFGGKCAYSGKEPKNLSESMRQDMLRVFPQLESSKIDYTWGGMVDITMNRAPHFGELAPDLYFMQGFSGHGVALTGLAGLITAEAILGHKNRLRSFESIKHNNFPGGKYLRTPALTLAMSYYRIRDYYS